MKRLLLSIMTLLACASVAHAAFPTNSNTKTINQLNLRDDFRDFNFTIRGYEDQEFNFTIQGITDLSTYSASFKGSKRRAGSTSNTVVILRTGSDVTLGTSNITFNLAKTNIPPDGPVKCELLLLDGSNSNVVRSLGRGMIRIVESLFDDDDGTFQNPSITNLTDFLTINAAATNYINKNGTLAWSSNQSVGSNSFTSISNIFGIGPGIITNFATIFTTNLWLGGVLFSPTNTPTKTGTNIWTGSNNFTAGTITMGTGTLTNEGANIGWVANVSNLLNSRIGTVSNDLDQLELGVTIISNDLNTLESDYAITSNNLNTVSNDLDQLELGVTIISNDLDTLEVSVTSLSNQYVATSNDLDILEASFGVVSNDYVVSSNLWTTQKVNNIQYQFFSNNAARILNALPTNRPAFNFTSDGSIITATITNTDGSSSLDFWFDSVLVSHSVPATQEMTVGTDAAEQEGWIYATTTEITNSTTRPTGKASILWNGSFLSAGHTQTNGVFSSQRWTDEISGPDAVERSIVSRLTERMRLFPAQWKSGSGASIVTNVNGGAEDDLYIQMVGSGVSWQMHQQNMSSFTNVTGIEHYHILNHPAGITHVTNLNEIALDSNSNAVLNANNSYFNVELVRHVSSGTTNAVGLEVGLLLSASDYSTESEALSDVDNQLVTSVDSIFRNSTIRIATLTLRRQSAGGGTWSCIVTSRLGMGLGLTGGGASAFPRSSVFADTLWRVHDDGDSTKLIALEASGISVSTTRTITMPDANVDLGNVSILISDVSTVSNDLDTVETYFTDGSATNALLLEDNNSAWHVNGDNHTNVVWTWGQTWQTPSNAAPFNIVRSTTMTEDFNLVGIERLCRAAGTNTFAAVYWNNATNANTDFATITENLAASSAYTSNSLAWSGTNGQQFGIAVTSGLSTNLWFSIVVQEKP